MARLPLASQFRERLNASTPPILVQVPQHGHQFSRRVSMGQRHDTEPGATAAYGLQVIVAGDRIKHSRAIPLVRCQVPEIGQGLALHQVEQSIVGQTEPWASVG
jgi:hypothetical protein